MKFGLEQHIIDTLITVFEANTKVDKAFIFGSRAKGNYRPDSDIDIAIKGFDISTDDIIAMSVAFEEKGIKHKFDLIDYNSIKEPALKDHIDRVGIEFYRRWKEYKLGVVTEIINGYAFKSSDFLDNKIENSLPIIKIKNVANGDVHLNDCHYHKYDKSLQKFLVHKNDILIALTGNHPEVMTQVVGEASRYKFEEKALLNQRVAKIIAKVEINDDFLYYFLKDDSTHNYLASQSAGSANQANISKGDIENVSVNLPPLVEQTAIASILSSLDDKIDLLHHQNKTLEQLAETLFRQWFVEEAEESWEEKKLGDLLTITSSKRIFYSEYVSSGIPFYRSKEIIELRKSGSTNSELFISNERFNEINNKFGSPREGDILMTSVGTLGVAYRVKKTDKFYFKDGNLTWFKDFKELPSSIIYLWLISKIGQEELASRTIGSTQEALTIEGLKSISFKVPPKDKIKLYELEFNTIIDKIEINQTQIRTLTQTRDMLLPKLISGEVRVNL